MLLFLFSLRYAFFNVLRVTLPLVFLFIRCLHHYSANPGAGQQGTGASFALSVVAFSARLL